MEIAIIGLIVVSILLLVWALRVYLEEDEVGVALVACIVSVCLFFGAFGINSMLVARNAVPVDDIGRVAVIAQSVEKAKDIYRFGFDNATYADMVCEDGESLKCADLKVGDNITFQKWKNDGWNWHLRPLKRI